MRRGDISNKPARQVIFRLEDIADEIKVSKIRRKLTIEINSSHLITKMNVLFMEKDVQLIISAVLPEKYREQVEDYLDSIDLLYKEVLIVGTEEELEEVIKRENIELVNSPYDNMLLWT